MSQEGRGHTGPICQLSYTNNNIVVCWLNKPYCGGSNKFKNIGGLVRPVFNILFSYWDKRNFRLKLKHLNLIDTLLIPMPKKGEKGKNGKRGKRKKRNKEKVLAKTQSKYGLQQ
jgi:hypothetical protein